MRGFVVALLAFAIPAVAQAGPSERESSSVQPVLLWLHGPNDQVAGRLRLQFPDWLVIERPNVTGCIRDRLDYARLSVPEHGAVAWIEHIGQLERVVVLTSAEGSPRVSPLPPADSRRFDWVVALLVDGLLREPTPPPYTWPSPTRESGAWLSSPRP